MMKHKRLDDMHTAHYERSNSIEARNNVMLFAPGAPAYGEQSEMMAMPAAPGHHHGLPSATSEFATLESPSQLNVLHSGGGGMVVGGGERMQHGGDSSDRMSDEYEDKHPRYVAGDHFYNYEMYGSLRKGGPVRFFSRECIGLLAAIFSSAFSYQVLQSVARPLMGTQLNLSKLEYVSVTRLVEMPMTLSFFVGLLSDSYPIRGLRRKGWMVVGTIVNAVAVLGIAGMSFYFESLTTTDRPRWIVVLALVLIAVASFGCIMTYVSIHTHVIELSQREPLRMRGVFTADYLIFRRIVSTCSNIFNYAAVGNGDAPRIKLSSMALLLVATTTVIPVPLLLAFWKEEYYSLPIKFKIRVQIFWKIMQQKAVWRILMFIALFVFFLSIDFKDSAKAVLSWTDGSYNDNPNWSTFIKDMVQILTTICWRQFFLNSRWRIYFAFAPILIVVPQLLASALVTYDVTRNRYLYTVLNDMPHISSGITALNNLVPLIEVIQEGSEAATVGLTLSLQRLVTVFVSTNAQGLFRGSNFYDVSAVADDGAEVRDNVFLSLVLNYGINLLAFLALIFLPAQKMDAQQLRMYGGFTKAASSAIVVFSLVLFFYSLVINVMTFVPSLSCLPLAGGAGCD